MAKTDPLAALDTIKPKITGTSKIRYYYPDPKDQQRILDAHNRGVPKVAIADILSNGCGAYISAKAVAAWIEQQARG